MKTSYIPLSVPRPGRGHSGGSAHLSCHPHAGIPRDGTAHSAVVACLGCYSNSNSRAQSHPNVVTGSPLHAYPDGNANGRRCADGLPDSAEACGNFNSRAQSHPYPEARLHAYPDGNANARSNADAG